MLENAFEAILVTSLVGTAATFILTAIRPITKKLFSSSWHYYMWLVVLLLMILPVSISLPEGAEWTPQEETHSRLYDTELSQDISLSSQSSRDDLQLSLQGENKPDRLQKLKAYAYDRLTIAAYLWAAGVGLLFFAKVTGYIIFLIKLRRYSYIVSCPQLLNFTNKKIIVRKSDKISSPLMIGFFKPTLLLPQTAMTEEQLGYVLAHEITHLKRNDIAYKWFVSAVKCIHWFNPVIYYINKQVNIECEISCDLAVVRDMSQEQKICYINTILALITAGNIKAAPLTTGMTGDKKTLKRRFSMIKSRVTMNRKTVIISVILALVILCGGILGSGVLNADLADKYENTLSNIKTDPRENNSFNLLILGLDEENRADTIMVLTFDEGNVTGVSIPRDTGFAIEGADKKLKLTEILNSADGEQKVIDTIKASLSIPITYYAKVNLIAVKEIIDSVGGIVIDVPADMEYDDPHKDLHISIKKGRQLLDGDKSCGLLQFRRSNSGTGYADGDMSRIKMGQQFIKEFISQKLNKKFINKFPEIFRILTDNLETNYPVSALKKDIELLSRAKSDISFDTISGRITTDDKGLLFYDIDAADDKEADANRQDAQNTSQQKNPLLKVSAEKTEYTGIKESEKSSESNLGVELITPAEGEIIRSFGKREHPITGEVKEHNGIDIKASKGTEVISSVAGIVTDVGFDADKGNYIVVESGNVKTIYSSLDTAKVKKGDSVSARQPIGTVGSTGKSTGAHLHFEVMTDGEYRNPDEFIK